MVTCIMQLCLGKKMTWIDGWELHVPCSIPWWYATVLKGGHPSLKIRCQDCIHHNRCRIISWKGLLVQVSPKISWDMTPTVWCEVTHVHQFFLIKSYIRIFTSKDIYPHHLPKPFDFLAFGTSQHSVQSFDLTKGTHAGHGYVPWSKVAFFWGWSFHL